MRILLIIAGAACVIYMLMMYGSGMVYEIAEIQREKRRRASPHAKRFRRRPLITVIVPTHNNESELPACLEALGRSAYRKLQIIVVDHNSSDGSRRAVKENIARYSRRDVRLVARRTDAIDYDELRRVYKRHGHGELVAIVPPDSRPAPDFFHAGLTYFADEADLDWAVPSQFTTEVASVAGIWEAYRTMLRQQTAKMLDRFGVISAGPTVLYRREAFMRRAAESTGRGRFARTMVVGLAAHNSLRRYLAASVRDAAPVLDMMVYRGFGSTSHTRLRQAARIIAAAMAVLAAVSITVVTGFAMYLAGRLHQPTLLIAIGGLATTVMVLSIWDARPLQFRQRLLYVVGIPVTYTALLLALPVRIVALLKAAPPKALHVPGGRA